MSRPARPWFRFYVEAVYDRKLRRLAPEHRWLFVACLAIARQSQEPGRLMIGADHAEATDLVDVACMDVDAVTWGMVSLMGAGVIAEDERGWYVPRWGDRQYESDDVTRRTARHRSKEQDSADLGTFPTRSQERPNHVPGNGPDTDTETDAETDAETEREGAISQTKSDPPATKRRKAGAPIPSPFFVSEANIAWVGTKCPGLDWDRETQKLVAWAKAGDKRYVDWDAAWKNWMLKAAERKPW